MILNQKPIHVANLSVVCASNMSIRPILKTYLDSCDDRNVEIVHEAFYKEKNILWTKWPPGKRVATKLISDEKANLKLKDAKALILHFVHYMLLIFLSLNVSFENISLLKVESVTDIPLTVVKLKVHRKQKTDNRATQAIDTEMSNFTLLSNILGKVLTCWSAPP